MSTNTFYVHARAFGYYDDAPDINAFKAGDGIIIIDTTPVDRENAQKFYGTITAIGSNTVSISANFTGYDTNKQYFITYSHWANTIAQQHTNGIWYANTDGKIATNVYAMRWG